MEHDSDNQNSACLGWWQHSLAACIGAISILALKLTRRAIGLFS
jgi:hypothetical protein